MQPHLAANIDIFQFSLALVLDFGSDLGHLSVRVAFRLEFRRWIRIGSQKISYQVALKNIPNGRH